MNDIPPEKKPGLELEVANFLQTMALKVLGAGAIPEMDELITTNEQVTLASFTTALMACDLPERFVRAGEVVGIRWLTSSLSAPEQEGGHLVHLFQVTTLGGVRFNVTDAALRAPRPS